MNGVDGVSKKEFRKWIRNEEVGRVDGGNSRGYSWIGVEESSGWSRWGSNRRIFILRLRITRRRRKSQREAGSTRISWKGGGRGRSLEEIGVGSREGRGGGRKQE